MKPFFLLLVAASVSLAAATIPGQYIVELTGEPAAARLAHRGLRVRGHARELQAHRQAVRLEQAPVRRAVEQANGVVVGAVDTVSDALLVRIPDAQASQLAALPGVKSVHPARTFHPTLDHAVAFHKVPDAWTQIGGPGNAGAGMKVGIIDTGIDITHPALQDPSLTVPDGFPKTDSDANTANTNNKVIVARSYMQYLPDKDPDQTARDHTGHGTGLAMIIAGHQVSGPLATIQGVAPAAQLGNYRIFGSAAVSGEGSELGILHALDDAVADGMDVINCSFGSSIAYPVDQDATVAAVNRATDAGVIVVISAGNSGPDLSTIGSPGTAASAITVGANNNDRVLAGAAALDGQPQMLAVPSDTSGSNNPLAGILTDITPLDPSGLACGTLPNGSLQGQIALVLRGVCNFSVKIANVQSAGASGVVIYTDQARPDAAAMSTSGSTLPAVMVSYQDGITLKQSIAGQPGQNVTLTFSRLPFYSNPNRIASFSSLGPNVDSSIKPDLLAVGTDFYMATESIDSTGEMYDASGYTVAQGTSFSAPLVAGAAALLKAAHPGLTAAQYRSLLINSTAPLVMTDGTQAYIQQSGTGLLDVSAALRSTAALVPSALSFGSGSGNPRVAQQLSLTNVGNAAETYSLSVVPRDGGVAPTLDTVNVTLDPGQSQTVNVRFTADTLSAGSYEGFLHVQGASSGIDSRIAYWYGVSSSTPQSIGVMYSTVSAAARTTVQSAILFHAMDASGLVLPSVTPQVSVVSGGGTVRAIASLGSQVPGAYAVDVRLGLAGANVFRIKVGSITRDVTITAN